MTLLLPTWGVIILAWTCLFQAPGSSCAESSFTSTASRLKCSGVAILTPPFSSISSILIWGKRRNFRLPSYSLLNPHLKLVSDRYKPFPTGIFFCFALLLHDILSFNPFSALHTKMHLFRQTLWKKGFTLEHLAQGHWTLGLHLYTVYPQNESVLYTQE